MNAVRDLFLNRFISANSVINNNSKGTERKESSTINEDPNRVLRYEVAADDDAHDFFAREGALTKKIIETKRHRKFVIGDSLGDDNEVPKSSNSLLDELIDLQGETGGTPVADGDFEDSGLAICNSIEVVEGGLIDMRGKVTNVDGSTIKMKSRNAAGLDESTDVELVASQIRSLIPEDARAKAIGGQHASEPSAALIVDSETSRNNADFAAIELSGMAYNRYLHKPKHCYLIENSHASNGIRNSPHTRTLYLPYCEEGSASS